MRGSYLVVRETSDGDRAVAATIDVEGLLNSERPLDIATNRADAVLAEGGVYRVVVIHDDGWSRERVLASRIAGRPWRIKSATKREP